VLDQLLEIEGMVEYPEVRDGSACLDDLRAELMGYEGLAAQRYWGAVKLLLPAQYGFVGREGRGALDPINAALNYGYGILYSQVERCLVLAGLDPYAGFIHVDRPGKPSLTLDFIEEFRQPVVDRTVFAMANQGSSFEQDDRKLLTQDTRHHLAEKIFDHMEASIQYEGKRHPIRAVMQMQARHMATFLRGERLTYEAFSMSW
jgi:CRISPR-associated protein Cas1